MPTNKLSKKPISHRSKKRSFLSIPAELRIIIYQYHYDTTNLIELMPKTAPYRVLEAYRIHSKGPISQRKDAPKQGIRSGDPLGKYNRATGLKTRWQLSISGLHLSNKKINSECLLFLHGSIKLMTQSYQRLSNFTAVVPKKSLKQITRLQLDHQTYGHPQNREDEVWKKRHDETWMRTCKLAVKKLPGLRELTINIDVRNVPLRFTLNESWVKPMLLFALRNSTLQYIKIRVFTPELAHTFVNAWDDKLWATYRPWLFGLAIAKKGDDHMQANKAQAQHAQRTKLANSYQELLDEFNSKDLRHVGNYTLGRMIGKGSFGKVYLATHKLTNGSKVVLKSAQKNDGNLAREIHHHRQFNHPHIARLYEVIVTESLVWLVLEYCSGDELYNHLLETGRMEEQKVQKIFTQLVGSVSYVHQKQCVHRDLKLENILLDKNGNVKLVDFGFTREYEGKSSYLQTWCGTVCYSAPEMLKGEKYAGEKVDVWSLGIILYALLCGELPFDEDDEDVTKQRILKEEPKYPDHLPPLAKDLIAILLSKRPLLRPSLADILQNPWLAEHAPRQQEILKLQQPAPFTTDLEKETLERMRSAGVDIDMVIENVLAQRCDSLAGWWTLLIEKEERKAKRRERKRKEREAEAKSVRRLSAASTRLERIAPTIREMDEDLLTVPKLGEPPRSRGRNMNRKSSGAAMAPDLPKLSETSTTPKSATPPPPVDKDSEAQTCACDLHITARSGEIIQEEDEEEDIEEVEEFSPVREGTCEEVLEGSVEEEEEAAFGAVRTNP
ncbi:hypothetical protein BLS_005156 [Venturia inaequalis]|uniref:Protein kinase domain-containing protein n=1 Tax=Venturia inaequalis TaxID=5025 RepID=A0A8H3V6G7_VENIN|nr:hypothetical protein BLS_005156 [Venturia inaequalis]